MVKKMFAGFAVAAEASRMARPAVMAVRTTSLWWRGSARAPSTPPFRGFPRSEA